MIYFCYRGLGGTYTQHIKETVKAINRQRPTTVSADMPFKKSFVVIIQDGEPPLERDNLKRILDREDVVFVVGDSKGIPREISSMAQWKGSVSPLPIGHRLEAVIIVEEVKRIISDEE